MADRLSRWLDSLDSHAYVVITAQLATMVFIIVLLILAVASL